MNSWSTRPEPDAGVTEMAGRSGANARRAGVGPGWRAAAKALVTGVLALSSLLPAGSSAGPAAASAHALVGDWEFDSSASEFRGAIPYREAQVSFRRNGRCIEVRQRILEGSARELVFSYRDCQDGQRSRVTGNPFYDSQSTRWPDGHTAIRTEYRGSAVSGSTTMTVSPDGKSYRATASRTLPNGRPYTSTIVWKRVSQTSR